MAKKMQKIFENQLKFNLLDQSTEKNVYLVLVVGHVQQISNSAVKAIVFEILDETDPFFFYSLRLTEDDFNNLKTSQGLLVDFASFPQQTIQLLQKCKSEEGQPNPRFSLFLRKDTNSAQVDIVETNGFRRLVHLNLRFCSPNEQALKSHLITAIRNLKEENARLSSRLQESTVSLQGRVEDLENKLAEKTLESERLRIEKDEKVASLSDRAQAEIEREKHKCAESEAALREQYSREFDELRNQYERNLDQLEARLHMSEDENKVSREQNQRFETTIRDLQAQLKASHEECKMLNQELAAVKQKAVRLDSDLQSQERAHSQVSHKLNALEKEICDKDVLIMKLQDQLAATCDTKRRISEEMERLESTVIRREEAVTNITEDLVKANQIIAKLQTENKALSTKLQVRGELVLQQEKVVESRESEVKSLRDEMRKTIEEKVRMEDELRQAKEDLEAVNAKMSDQEKTLKTNETVISWLNQQLTELQTQNGGEKPLSSRQVAASLASISKPPHLGQLRSTRSENSRPSDHSDGSQENEEPIDPIYFQPSPSKENVSSTSRKTSTPQSQEPSTRGHNRTGGARPPFLKSASVPTKGTQKVTANHQAKPSAYFAR